MKKTLLLLAIIGFTLGAQAQVTKTISVTPGDLYKVLTHPEKQEITHLILTGSIDAQDFKTMRDAMPLLEVVDLSKVVIVAYEGTKGTVGNAKKAKYLAGEIPQFAFFNDKNITGKKTITNIIFPKNLGGIGEKAFWSCYALSEVTIPETVVEIGEEAYSKCKSLNSITVMNSKPVSKLGKGVFLGVDPSSCIVHVPIGAKDAYQGAKQWKDFLNISDDVDTKTAEVE